MEFILGLLTGYLLTWPGLIILLVLGAILEANESHGWAIFIGIISAVVAYFFFNASFVNIAYYSISYFIVGFLWSFWRYKRHADRIVAEYKDQDLTAKKKALARLDPRQMLDKITAWVIIWPFSMFENVLGDITKLVQTFITRFFKGIYTKIYSVAVNQLVPEVNSSVTNEKV